MKQKKLKEILTHIVIIKLTELTGSRSAFSPLLGVRLILLALGFNTFRYNGGISGSGSVKDVLRLVFVISLTPD